MLLLKLVAPLFLAYVVTAEQEKVFPKEITQDIPKRFNGQKGCYIPELDEVIKRNKRYYPTGQCKRYACYDETFEAIRYTCDPVEEKEGCTIIKGDKEARYLDCCHTQNCN